MSRVFWVRHGPTHATGMVGWSDLPADLSDAAALSRLNGFLPDEAMLISSDLSRAVATADALHTAGRERLSHDPDLREMHFGAWELKRSAEISVSHPDLSRAFWTDPGAHTPPDGESWDVLGQRVQRAVTRFQTLAQGRDVIAVAHIGVILSQVGAVSRRPAREVIGEKIDNLSVTVLEAADDGWQVARINHCP